MSQSRATISKRKAPALPEREFRATRAVLLFFAIAFGAALVVYGPAITGPYVFDDRAQRYSELVGAGHSLKYWIEGLRPMLYFSFWLNHMILGDKPLGYHLVNILIHALNSTLVLVITYRLLNFSGVSATPAIRKLLAGFAAALFLLHPIQTESVSYIASRSETLCAFFILAAWALFVYRLPGAVSWPVAAGILALFAAAAATKENAVVLAPLLVLTDLFWNVDFSVSALRKNWRIYSPLVAGGVVAGIAVMRIVGESTSAGFHLRSVTGIQYILTECRVFFIYLRLFLLPAGQSIDHDVPISRTIFQYGSLIGLIAILLLIAAAVYFRRRYRLASFGVFLWLILLAPTSSFIPLSDPMAEHRLYLPVLALCLVLLDVLLHTRIPTARLAAVCVAVLCIGGGLTFARNQVWGNGILLWQDAVAKAPAKIRPYSNLAVEYIAARRCGEASDLLSKAPSTVQENEEVLLVWGRSEECRGRFDQASKLIAQAAGKRPSAQLYLEIGIMRSKQGKAPEAYDAFARAIEIDPFSKQAYIYRGAWYEAARQFDMAARDYRRAVQLDPGNQALRERLDSLEQQLRISGSALKPFSGPASGGADRSLLQKEIPDKHGVDPGRVEAANGVARSAN